MLTRPTAGSYFECCFPHQTLGEGRGREGGGEGRGKGEGNAGERGGGINSPQLTTQLCAGCLEG